MRTFLKIAALSLSCLCAGFEVASAVESVRTRKIIVVDEPTVIDVPVVLDEPVFPGVVPRRPVRLWSGIFLAPEAAFGDSSVSLMRPEVRVRAGLPFSASLNLEVAADFQASRYDVTGDEALFEGCPQCLEPNDFYATSIGTQAGIRLNGDRHVFLAAEQWGLLAALFTRARWEPGAFVSGVTPGGSLAFGYQIPDHLRLAVGARIERALDGDGIRIDPTIYLRWDVWPRLQLKSRGMGGTLEYAVNQRSEAFLTAFRESEAFRLEDRPGLDVGATFRDRRALVGGGIILTVVHSLKVSAEVGAIVDRRVAVNTRSDGRLAARSGDPSPYAALRAEVRF